MNRYDPFPKVTDKGKIIAGRAGSQRSGQTSIREIIRSETEKIAKTVVYLKKKPDIWVIF